VTAVYNTYSTVSNAYLFYVSFAGGIGLASRELVLVLVLLQLVLTINCLCCALPL